ncbi:acetyl/propionyl/methylcrotonyl-CoA carboxylase subunit alpha [Ferrimonas lipolytica]|uniref:Biotin carboxylase n=1 Tax=Ferrimonas lipolytica TaxID=2724191 RepID=A0A6H1U9B9_9GAMM|nr:acetyl/propionyl/methylcrotonyl-CoA carboxylase subunit alpha [Ferrimonas lipolytica]QIZ75631.1 acetyl/propionyl/methylcrotonyl-CoA carboxylase subunit alpha [Ferrimonas lipolytica]
MSHSLTKVLIANRGEIACRVMTTCRQLGIATVAVYSDVDRHAQHVLQADQAFHIGAAEAKHSYLDYHKILAVAKQAGCDGIHPGYGFLSENPDFARACAASGIAFIGPSATAIEQMGSKSAAKIIMAEAAVPMLPGYHGDDQSDACLISEARLIGYPLLVKAAFGGGGKGMRIVEQDEELQGALDSARREAQSAFGNPQLLLERYLTSARHVEVQVFADNHGNAVYLSDRDCSLQRRHQKVVEEAPAPGLSDELRQQMGEASVRAAQAINYSGAGTVEYLLDEQGRFYFMEMNTRLQVEHPVTELVTNQDLVQWQLMVAANNPLPLQQAEITVQGHAFEVRLYAEDPQRDFMPATGTIKKLSWPVGDGMRIDSGIAAGDHITAYYDPMLAKLISCGDNRNQALARMGQMLDNCQLLGLSHNLPYLAKVIRHPQFAAADLDTAFLARHQQQLLSRSDHSLAASIAALIQLQQQGGNSSINAGWRLNAAATVRLQFSDNHDVHHLVELTHLSGQYWRDSHDRKLQLMVDVDQVELEHNGEISRFGYHQDNDGISLQLSDGAIVFRPYQHQAEAAGNGGEKSLQAPMNGTFIANLVALGQQVHAGQALVVMEAMKMEYTIKAPSDSVVSKLPFDSGDLVNDGVALIELTATEQEASA